MLVLSLATMSVAVVITAFSPNVWVYAALRFVCRFGRSMAGTSAMVLSTEFESPRWLLVHGRKQEAIEALQQIASLNGGEGITMSSFTMLDTCAMEVRDGVAGGEGMFATLRSICERRWVLQRLAAITTASFSIGVVYYGMPLSVGSLSSDLYLNVAYNAVAELPSSVLSWLLMGRFNRRTSVVELTVVSGLCSLACIVISANPEAGTSGLRLAAELSSFASCATTRSSGTTASRQPLPRCQHLRCCARPSPRTAPRQPPPAQVYTRVLIRVKSMIYRFRKNQEFGQLRIGRFGIYGI
uniref:H(+)/Pi cotransporter n=1 Tax=Oryza meridionalis TaxID=40149 RepID=A0A0E0DVB7_9ORYZ